MSDAIDARATEGAALAIQGPPDGFGEGVNQYLNHYVVVTDAKAGSIVGMAMVLLGFLLSDSSGARYHGTIGAVALASALAACLLGLVTVFPRLPKGNQGPIFWEDIRNHGTEDAYVAAVGRLARRDGELALARQNFHVASVVHEKLVWVRWGIRAVAVSLLATAIATWRV